MTIKYFVVDITDEQDELVGYGICKEYSYNGQASQWVMEDRIYATRGQAHVARGKRAAVA